VQIEKYVIDEKTAGVAPGRFDLKYMLRINIWGAFQFGLREKYKRLLLGIRWDQNIDILNGKHPAMCSGGCARKDPPEDFHCPQLLYNIGKFSRDLCGQKLG
jgi:hypothetical protein